MTDTSIRISRRTLNRLRVLKVLGGYKTYDDALQDLLNQGYYEKRRDHQ